MDGRSDAPGSDVAIVVSVGAGLLLALAVLAVFRSGEWVLTALAVGILVALALDPVLRAVQRRFSCSRASGTIAIGAILTAAFAAVMLFLAPQAIDQAGQFTEELPATVEELYGWPVVGERLEEWDAVSRVERFVDELPARLSGDSFADLASRALGAVGAAVIVLVTAIAVLLDGESIVERTRAAIPADRRERADDIGGIVYRSIARYFAGSISVALLNGTVILVAGLLLGVPLAPLAGIWAAITNLIPQIGGFLGGSFFVLLAVTQGALTGLIALVIFLGYQQLENNVIQPTVIGRAVNLTPPTTMLAALIGGAAAGVPGALVATPLLGATKSVWIEVTGRRRSADSAPASATARDSGR
jgi:predicted PurR-regulated permease PerM